MDFGYVIIVTNAAALVAANFVVGVLVISGSLFVVVFNSSETELSQGYFMVSRPNLVGLGLGRLVNAPQL